MRKIITIANAVKFSKIIVVTIFVLMIIFTAVMIIIYCTQGSVPDTLIQEFFGFFKLEGGALSAIKIAEVLIGLTGRKKKTDETSEIVVEQTDIVNNRGE